MDEILTMDEMFERHEDDHKSGGDTPENGWWLTFTDDNGNSITYRPYNFTGSLWQKEDSDA